MPKRVRRVIRRVPPLSSAAFDDQLWPVNVVLLILGGFLTGEILIFGDFATSSVFSNAWTWLSWVWFAAIGSMVLAWKSRGRMARRTQLSGAVALIITICMLTSCYYFDIFTAVAIEDTPSDAAPKPEIVTQEVVQYLEIQQKKIVLDHERPVETEPVKADTKEIVKQTTETEAAVQSKVADADTTAEIEHLEVSPREQTEVRRTPPKQADSTGKLSRQPNPAPTRPDQVASPSASTQEQAPAAAKLDAPSQPLKPRNSTAASQRPTPATEATTEVEQPSLQSARRPTASSDKPQLDTSRPALQRAVRAPAELPSVPQIAKVRPSADDSSEPSRLEPSHTIERQQAASDTVKPQQPSDNVVAAKPRSAEPTRATPAPRQPQLAQNDVSAPSRNASLASTAKDTRATPGETVAQPQESSTPLQPKAATVGRKAPTASRAPTADAAPDSDRPVTSSSEAVAKSQRAPSATVPTLQPNAQASDKPRRSSRIAESAASPVAISDPAVVQSSQPNQREAEPRASAHSIARRGVAGTGAQRNLDDGDPAPRTVAAVASSAARRSASSSENPEPNDLLTSQQASVAKDRALANAPSSTLEAEPFDAATASGVAEPSELDASSSAAMRTNSASQNRAALTADAGNTDFDTGPTQIASELESGRASGGGEPEVHHATPSADVRRNTTTGGEQLAALDVRAVAPQPEDIEADGGGQPPAPAADAAATSATRAKTSATTPAASQNETDHQQESGLSARQAEQQAARRRQLSGSAPATEEASHGGGTDQPVRDGGIQHTALAKANAPAIESPAGGQAAPEVLQASTGRLSRVGGDQGQVATPVPQPTGAAESDVAMNVPDLGADGTRGAQRSKVPDGDQEAPAPSTGGAPLKQQNTANLPGVAKVQLDNELAGGAPTSETPAEDTSPAAGQGSLQRRSDGGTQVLAPADPDVGGLGLEPSEQVGNPSRKAQRTSDVVTADADARFQRREVGGPVQAGSTRARDARPAFEKRKNTQQAEGNPGARPRHLEVAIRTGLEFLRLQQNDNGSWSLHNFPAAQDGSLDDEIAQIHSDAAATGLTLMCFLGGGFDHFDYGGQYAREIQAGLDYLVKNQQENGNLYIAQDANSNRSAAFYSHAIATTALCEAYGMTRDPKLKVPAQKALQYIAAIQHPERGGWRYIAGSSSDLSVTGWMFVALKSGKLAGLEVSEESTKAALAYLDRCQTKSNGENGYVYNPDAIDQQKQGREVSRPMTAVGLMMRLYQGRDRSDAEIRSGADFLLSQPPAYYAGQRDTYYWYYATQVMFHMKGDYWETWQRHLHELLRDTQEKEGPLAGSWNPRGAVPDRWGAHGGRIYVTAMNLLSLEVSYRYMPLYVEVE